MLKLSIDGKPEPGGSKTAYPIGGRCVITDANKKAAPWKKSVVEQVQRQLDDSFVMFDEAIILAATFFVDRPKGHWLSDGKSLSAAGRRRQRPCVKPDALKLMRPLEDALSGIIWTDDALIVDEQISKRYCVAGERPGVEIAVFPALEYQMVVNFKFIERGERILES